LVCSSGVRNALVQQEAPPGIQNCFNFSAIYFDNRSSLQPPD
jgi:hypothetical protein